MTIGSMLLALRKEKHLSQEEVAEKLNVTRQTVSKWETDQSTPDFDKIVPLCELYDITADELLQGKRKQKTNHEQEKNKKTTASYRAKGIGLGVLLYFVAIIWVMVTVPVFRMNPVISSAFFLLICGVATYFIIYTCIVYKKETQKVKEKESTFLKQCRVIIYMIATIVYFLVSFMTLAWHITWMIWIIAALISEIVKLLFMLGEKKNEE